MANALKKTITTTVTLTVGKDDRGQPIEKPPGTPVELDADEADSILKRFGGAEVGKKGVTAAEAPSQQQKKEAGGDGGGDEKVNLGDMTRKQLDAYAQERHELDTTKLQSKGDVIEAIEAAAKPKG